MRVFMSDPAQSYDRIQAVKVAPTLAALAEARAILAESECETRVSVLPCYFRAGHGVYAGAPHVALAESIRRAIESGAFDAR